MQTRDTGILDRLYAELTPDDRKVFIDALLDLEDAARFEFLYNYHTVAPHDLVLIQTDLPYAAYSSDVTTQLNELIDSVMETARVIALADAEEAMRYTKKKQTVANNNNQHDTKSEIYIPSFDYKTKLLPDLEAIQDELLDSISQEPASTNPVITPKGKTYDRENIINWLEHSKTDPCTRDPLTVQQLRVNASYTPLMNYYSSDSVDLDLFPIELFDHNNKVFVQPVVDPQGNTINSTKTEKVIPYTNLAVKNVICILGEKRVKTANLLNQAYSHLNQNDRLTFLLALLNFRASSQEILLQRQKKVSQQNLAALFFHLRSCGESATKPDTIDEIKQIYEHPNYSQLLDLAKTILLKKSDQSQRKPFSFYNPLAYFFKPKQTAKTKATNPKIALDEQSIEHIIYLSKFVAKLSKSVSEHLDEMKRKRILYFIDAACLVQNILSGKSNADTREYLEAFQSLHSLNHPKLKEAVTYAEQMLSRPKTPTLS